MCNYNGIYTIVFMNYFSSTQREFGGLAIELSQTWNSGAVMWTTLPLRTFSDPVDIQDVEVFIHSAWIQMGFAGEMQKLAENVDPASEDWHATVTHLQTFIASKLL